MVLKIEAAPENSLILIEEIENGLHPIATRRMVEYLIDVANRKSIQVIFTTHSDYALAPLPSEAIWASIEGKLHHGNLTVEALRAVSGRVDKKLAIFVEDKFAKTWVETILREGLKADFDHLEIHEVRGDGTAVKTHRSHVSNPATKFKSVCIIDGDSKQNEDEQSGIFRLPGEQPERFVFESVNSNLGQNLAILTVSCHRPPEAQDAVKKAIDDVSASNRDAHLLFNQIGMAIGYIPEDTVKGAFLAIWVRANRDFCDKLKNDIASLLK